MGEDIVKQAKQVIDTVEKYRSKEAPYALKIVLWPVVWLMKFAKWIFQLMGTGVSMVRTGTP